MLNIPKEIYIFIIYPKSKDIQNNEMAFKDKKVLIQNIYTEKNEKFQKDNIVILKYTVKNDAKKPSKKEDTNAKNPSKKEDKKVKIEFMADKEKKINYLIEFELANKTFIYEPK